MKAITVTLLILATISCTSLHAQKTDTTIASVKKFMTEYAEDLRQKKREAIANRYDTAGYLSLGNGIKRFYTFDQTKNRYINNWRGPSSFEWKDISVDPISRDAALVTALFDYGDTLGIQTLSYSALLVRQNGNWKIRMEDESVSPAGYTIQTISGNNQSGPYKYSLTARPGTSIGSHRHSSDMKITVKKGQKFILMGDLDNARVQRFPAGTSFTIPANTWHLEWWEQETVEEIEVMTPMKTERATPVSPRKGM